MVIPEAWKFAPEGKGSPVKPPLESIAREGAGVGLYVFLDSQDITGVDKAILKNVDTWILGRQREKNEVERTIAQLPAPVGRRLKPAEIMRLELGHFLVASKNDVRAVYVKPQWLSVEHATIVAKTGKMDVARAYAPPRPIQQEEEDVDVGLKEENVELKRLRELEDELRTRPSAAPATTPASKENNGAPATRERVRHDLNVDVAVPTLRITERVVTLTATSEDPRGRAALLLAEGFFDSVRAVPEVCREFEARGWGKWYGGKGHSWNKMNLILWGLAEMGFLRREDKEYVVIEEAKKRIERVKESERR